MKNLYPNTLGQKRSSKFGRAMQRSAEHRKCPQCNRKSALCHVYEDGIGLTYCRWCGYERTRVREVQVSTDPA